MYMGINFSFDVVIYFTGSAVVKAELTIQHLQYVVWKNFH